MENRQPWLSVRWYRTSAVGPAEVYQMGEPFKWQWPVK